MNVNITYTSYEVNRYFSNMYHYLIAKPTQLHEALIQRWVLSGSWDLFDIYDARIFTRSISVKKLKTGCCGRYINNLGR